MKLFYPKRVIRLRIQFRDVADVSPFLLWLRKAVNRNWTGIVVEIKGRED